MPGIKFNEFTEVNLTPHELHTAMQLMDKGLSQVYLQNMRVEITRMILGITFNKPADDLEQFRYHASLVGKMELLDQLIKDILEPVEIPLNPEGDNLPPQTQL